MKKFKFLVAVLTVFLLGLGVYSCQKEDKTNVVNQVPVPSAGFGESCNPNATNCSPYVEEIINNFTLPEYPGCVFRIQVSYCIDQGSLGTEIYVSNYKLLDITDCLSLWEEWSDLVLDPASQQGEINDFVNNLDLQVYSRLENYFFAKYGNIVGCGKAFGTLVVTFYKSTCNTICYYGYTTNPYPHEGTGGNESLDNNAVEYRMGGFGMFVRTNCVNSGCCQRQTFICYDPVTDQVQKNTNSNPFPASTLGPIVCAGGPVDEPDIPSGAHVISCLPCSFRCE